MSFHSDPPWSFWLARQSRWSISSWLKSRVAPFTNSRLSWSTMMPTPPCSNTLHAGGNRVGWINGRGWCKTTTSEIGVWQLTCHLHSCYWQQKTCTGTRSSRLPPHVFSDNPPCPWFPRVSVLKGGQGYGEFNTLTGTAWQCILTWYCLIVHHHISDMNTVDK